MTMTNTEAAKRLNLMAEAVKLLDGVGVVSMTVYGDDDHILVRDNSLIKYLKSHGITAYTVERAEASYHGYTHVLLVQVCGITVKTLLSPTMLKELEVKE